MKGGVEPAETAVSATLRTLRVGGEHTSAGVRFSLLPVALATMWGQWVAVGFLLRWLIALFGYDLGVESKQILAAAAAIVLLVLASQFLKTLRWLLTGYGKERGRQ